MMAKSAGQGTFPLCRGFKSLLRYHCPAAKCSPERWQNPESPQKCGLFAFKLLSATVPKSGIFLLSRPTFSKALDLRHSNMSCTTFVFVALFGLSSSCQFSVPPLDRELLTRTSPLKCVAFFAFSDPGLTSCACLGATASHPPWPFPARNSALPHFSRPSGAGTATGRPWS